VQETVNREGHDEIEASKAPLMDHLIELRQRLIYALMGVGVGFIICFAFATHIYNLLVLPYVWARGGGQKIEMIYTAPHEFFFTKLKLALFGAVFLAFPLIAYQAYKFVAPGLYKNERQAFRPYLLWTFVLFVLGALVVFFIVMPLAMRFFLSMEQTGGQIEIHGSQETHPVLACQAQIADVECHLMMLTETAGMQHFHISPKNALTPRNPGLGWTHSVSGRDLGHPGPWTTIRAR